MTDPAHAVHFAHRACHEQVTILENTRIARDTFRLRFECPKLARHVVPGQFLMLRLAGCDDPLLGRPMALYDTHDGPEGVRTEVEVVYLVVGKMTGLLSQAPSGQKLEVWGPLGNGFAPQGCEHLVMVAGGIGQTPFLALAREHLGGRHYGHPARKVCPVARVTLCYGARGKEYLAGIPEFERAGMEVLVSTDDGSAGHHGLVTEVAEQVLASSPAARVVCCGPERMMEAVAHLAARLRVPCQVSLETPMACGIGICFSCVAKVRDEAGGWDYRRTCVEGPIFDAARIEW
jgi:dihydroorotate dehydrogenase electron transfer subunit